MSRPRAALPARLRRLCGALIIAAAGELAAQGATPPVTRPRTAAEDLQLFSQVYNQIRINHPDSLDAHRLFMAAIQAMVQATDPHSYVIPSVRLVPGKEAALRAGRLHPVPIEFSVIGGSPIVVGVAAGTQARRQDILAGDELVAVDGAAVQVESATELEILLAGPRNTTVALTFERRRPSGEYATLVRTVRRERYSDESAVPAAIMLDERTGYVRITTFANERVAEDLRAAVTRLEGLGMQRMVLDLRGNAGGSVAEAASVSGEFLPAGSIVYTSEGRRAEVTDTGRVSRSFWRRERAYPLIVLIDGETASASELVAGALQDHDRALIVGTPSFGKSLLMRGFPLSDGSILMLVIGKVRTPCGRSIQREYRDVSARRYYRAASAERDTIGLPTCRTAGGRTLYGGGGIRPDVRLDDASAAPEWIARASELDLPLKWANGFVGSWAKAPASADAFARAPTLPESAVGEFRALAATNGVTIPEDEPSTRRVRTWLAASVAWVKWGDPGYYLLEARTDRIIADAIPLFDRAPVPRR
jgi:carboxyl-terminal processing protease